MSKFKTVVIFLIIAAFLSGYFTFMVVKGIPLKFDSIVRSGVINIFSDGSYPFFKFLNTLGSKIGIGVISLLFVVWLRIRKKNYAGMAMFVFTVALGSLLNKWIKEIIARPRPELEHIVTIRSFSFPSSHAMMGMILYMLIGYFIVKELNSAGAKWLAGILAGIIILLMGVSRIVLNVHYPSDVAAGFSFGFIWTCSWIFLYNILKTRLNL